MCCPPLPRRPSCPWTTTGGNRGSSGSVWTLRASGGPRWTRRPQERWSKVCIAQMSILGDSHLSKCMIIDHEWRRVTPSVSTGVRADSVAVDWLGRNLYWIDGVNSQIVAVRLATTTVKSLDHSVILDEDLDQPRSLALLPQKGSAWLYCTLQTILQCF